MFGRVGAFGHLDRSALCRWDFTGHFGGFFWGDGTSGYVAHNDKDSVWPDERNTYKKVMRSFSAASVDEYRGMNSTMSG